MPNLTITLIQKDLLWEQPDKNRAAFESFLTKHTAKSDLVILPEMFTTGFSMNPNKFSERMNGPSVQWMQTMAKIHQTSIIGSLIIQENTHYYNRLIWVSPDQTIQSYDKRHLFSFGNEHLHYQAGTATLETTLHGWRIRPLICYDLRFPVWSRNTTDYDLLIYVANWPERRIHHWKSLLIARAIENQSYVIGLNRVGLDGNNINHNGNSLVISPQGAVLLELINDEKIETITLSRQIQDEYRASFPALQDRD